MVQKKKITGRPRRPGNFIRVHFALPENLYKALQTAAGKNHRTATAELLIALEKHLAGTL